MINGINEDNLSEALVDKADIDLGNVSEINGEMNLQLESKADKTTFNTSVSDLQSQINSLQTLVNQLQTTLASAKYVVETWRDGTEWYRKYNDGWIEQGGRIAATASQLSDQKYTFSLKTNFTTTHYYIGNILIYTASTGNWGTGCAGIYAKTTSSATILTDGINGSHPITGFDWYACGY